MNLKKTMLFFHRWLGFIAGLVVFIVSITGCIFCFQDEIQDAIHPYRTVAVQNAPYVAPSKLKAIALAGYPSATASYIYYYGKNRPAAVLIGTKTHDLIYVYLNPYTGSILHAEGLKENFFVIVQYIHLYLLLPPKIGQMVVGVSVIVFIVLMITGIILWWPKRKNDLKRSFTIKWNGRWRRINYDLHNVLGFYATGIALILALSGLSIAYQWVQKGIYQTLNLTKSYANENKYPKSDSLKVAYIMPAIDKALIFAEEQSPAAQMFLIAANAGKEETINVTAYAKSLHFGQSDFYFFDKYSGKLLKQLPNAKKSLGMQANDLNYDIHVGQALGVPGKIIAFLASLVCATLPVTGFIIWLGKRKKKKRVPGKTVVHKGGRRQMVYAAK